MVLRKRHLVSAIVSVYNAERFMRGLLEDLEAQTIAGELEIIIIDSNSPQNEKAIVRQFQERYDNIVYMRTKKRETSHAAVNRGIKAARGKYVTLANADDRHRVDALERMVEFLEANPEIALVYANVYITKTENETFENHTRVGKFRWLDFDPLRLVFGCFIGPQPMWRRSIHKKYGYFDPSLESAGDWEFWLRIAGREKFLHIDEYLGLYLYSPTSVEHRNPDLSRREALQAHQMYLPRAARILGKRLEGGTPEEQKVEQIASIGAGTHPKRSTSPLLIVDSNQGTPAQLTACLQRVERNTEDLPHCLIVGSNAHPMSKLQMEVSFAPNQTLLSALRQSLDLGIKRVILLSPDVLVSKGWLKLLVDTLEGNENINIAAVGPCANQAPSPQRIEPHYRSLEGGLCKFAKGRHDLYNGYWKEVPYLGGFCLLLNLDILRQVGGLPRSMSLSDALWDLFVRLRSANYKLVIMPGVYVHHDKFNLNEGANFDQRTKARSRELAKLSEEEFNRQNFAKAGELLEESLNLDPQNAEALNNLGVMLLQSNMVSEALGLFERATQLNPGNEEIASNYKETALLAQKLSRFDGHIRSLLIRNRKMIKSKGVEGETEQEVSKSREEKTMEERSKVNHDSDIEVYRKLARDDPQNVGNLKVLSEKLTEAGKYDEAVDYWENLLKLSPNSDSYQSLGNCYFKMEEYEKASEALLKGLELNPDDANILNDLGVISMAKGDLEEAINYFQKGLKSVPNSPDILLNLALICYQVGLYEEAAGLLEKYTHLESSGADIHLCLGDCYFNLERKDLAKREFELALSLDPDMEEAQKRLRELQE